MVILVLWVTYLSGCAVAFGLMLYSIILDHIRGEERFKWLSLLVLVIVTISSWIMVGVYISQEFKPHPIPQQLNHEEE